MLDPLTGYPALLKEIKDRIRSAQYEALKSVNKELIFLYWDIGRMIIEKQQGQTWGKSVVEKLSEDLRNEFLGIKGFSASNLWRMKVFYETYSQNEKLAQLVREIGWSHNIAIMEMCHDDREREFYLNAAIQFGWGRNTIIHQIESQTFIKTMDNQTNFTVSMPKKLSNQARLAVKDEYTFDFLEMGDERNERRLEYAVLAKIEPFLREMGGLFAFVGSQYRLSVADEEYFIDLLLYHRQLKCLVAIELKTGTFLPEYVGKMQFYLAALDDIVRMQGENPSIGMILCKSKNRTIVEYALRESKKPIGVAIYKLLRKLPEELRKQLPDQRQIEMLLVENAEVKKA